MDDPLSDGWIGLGLEKSDDLPKGTVLHWVDDTERGTTDIVKVLYVRYRSLQMR